MYEIQHETLGGWVNTWTDNNLFPVLFKSKEDAEQELADYLADYNSDAEYPYDESEYRVEQVSLWKIIGYCYQWLVSFIKQE